jgi:DNA-binding GntR family transcriptional regulator
MSELGELEPVARQSTAELIAEQLRAAIMYGVFAPGTQLGEAELAARFAVSRGPLREAMQRLVQQGILRSEPHRGVFVASLTDEDVRDIYLARTAIEVAACRLVLRGDRHATADRLAAAHRAMAAAAERGDRAGLAAADMELHQILVDASGSPRLQRMAATLFVEARMCLSALTVKYTAPIDLVDEHAAIIEALRGGDEALLIDLLDEHMKDAVRLLAPTAAPTEPADARPA